MTIADKAKPKVKTKARRVIKEGITLQALVDRLGDRAAREFFNRIDGTLREGTVIVGTSVRDARVGFGKAMTSSAKVVVPGRTSGRRRSSVDPSEGFVIMKIDDLEAVVRAGQDEFDWGQAFAPRAGLEAATTTPVLKRGSRGRRHLQV
ncbi:hypothetical protein [Methylocystis sp.]|uniref:hypothetical protein n=1 Tax=Methylocystis sp. TaxID=1911079 RepID=UPI0025CBD8E9|nr:hypothetical protein [Methylocystis sp.]